MTEKHVQPHLRVEYNSKKGVEKNRAWSSLVDYHIASTDSHDNAMWVGTVIKSFLETMQANGNTYIRILYYERTSMALSNGEVRIREQNETVVAGPSCRDEGEVESFGDENEDGWFELNVLLPMSPELKAQYPQQEKESLMREAAEAAIVQAEDEKDAEAQRNDPAAEEVETISPGDTIVAFDSMGNAIEFSIPE